LASVLITPGIYGERITRYRNEINKVETSDTHAFTHTGNAGI